MLNAFLWLLGAIACFLFINFVIKPILERITKKNPPLYNGEKPDTDFESWNGIGIILLGEFRKDQQNDSIVKYSFFSLFVPLIPLQCYRVKEVYNESFGGGYIQEHKSKYKIYGTEKWNFWEVCLTYLNILCGIFFFITFVNVVIHIYDWMHK